MKSYDYSKDYDYAPDLWEIVQIGEDLKKVFGCWYGGYNGSDSWRMSSGITKVEDVGNAYRVTNHSGSVYFCHKQSKGMHGYGRGVFNTYKEEAEKAGLIFKKVEISVTDES
jgi:hypothetical protein